MPKHRRMKLMDREEQSYGGASGEYPDFGAIFMSNNSTRKECLGRELFGLPMRQAGFVKQVKAGMLLFLFEFESRELHGVFLASSDGAINIEPDAFCSSGKQFPAQVKFTEKWRCRPLPESEFRHAIRENYFTATKFNFGLSKAQVQKLLKLFSLKKEDRSRLRKTAVVKPTREAERNLRNRVGDRCFRNFNAGETDGDVDCEFPFRVTSAGDARDRRPAENYGFEDESGIGVEVDSTKGNEYSGDTSGINLNYSFGTDALTNNSFVNDRRVPKNLRHTASGWLENKYNEKDGIAQWSNDEHLKFEAVPVVTPRSIPLDLPYGTNRGYYDPCEPGIMGDATMTSSRHDLGAPNDDLIGSASVPANSNYDFGEEYIPVGGYVSDNLPSKNSNYDFGEEYIPVGGYVSDALPSETVQPFSDEHNGTSVNTSSLEYIPMPIEHHRQYQTNIGMSGVAGAESESRNGHLRHYQFPGDLTSTRATENMRKVERLPYPDDRIFPSFTYPSSSRGFSSKDELNNEVQTYKHQEEFGGHVSYTNKTAVRGSSIYPSFAYPSTTGDGADLYDRTSNKGQAYQRHEEFGGDAFDSNNRVTRMKERVNHAELGRTKTRESVFKRLGVPPSKERYAEKDTSPETESVDDVMAFLNDCHKVWMEKKRSNMSTSEDSGKPKKKKEKIQRAEVLDNDLIHPFTETTPDDLLDCEGSMEQNVQKLPFINFKRRSKAPKSPGDLTQGCKESPETPASQNKKRKLLRPKLIEDDSEKDRGNKDNPIRIVLASENDRGKNEDPIIENILASQSAGEVPVHDFIGRKEDDSKNDDRGKNEDPTENILASQSAIEVPVHDFLGRNEADSENEDPIENTLASQSAVEVPVHDFLGRDEDGSEKDRENDGDPIDNVLPTQSATEVPFHDFLGRDDQ
ncbi:PREDICTED: uncharacterized protein LOC104786039 [Camelina sativa]|uniref:Uncharacterized protein LOC104786039 n=1 Tax=Camelina sativa TaxID=90675 RepID=A0ABM0Z2V9_CAMSA|nr:PREDICTED: uncharacterized protein LOC104786039 [Camelina sativa]XP_010509654.1 PREDICTED: uncharacterized protein LOC104786039 [Camelina sativa]XP_010509655.1 PREDICTED: uncharacterized protein LOC104786039 [Camelina sativa]